MPVVDIVEAIIHTHNSIVPNDSLKHTSAASIGHVN